MDFIDALKPSITCYKKDGKDFYLACNRGVIVKKGEDPIISSFEKKKSLEEESDSDYESDEVK